MDTKELIGFIVPPAMTVIFDFLMIFASSVDSNAMILIELLFKSNGGGLALMRTIEVSYP